MARRCGSWRWRQLRLIQRRLGNQAARSCQQQQHCHQTPPVSDSTTQTFTNPMEHVPLSDAFDLRTGAPGAQPSALALSDSYVQCNQDFGQNRCSVNNRHSSPETAGGEARLPPHTMTEPGTWVSGTGSVRRSSPEPQRWYDECGRDSSLRCRAASSSGKIKRQVARSRTTPRQIH